MDLVLFRRLGHRSRHVAVGDLGYIRDQVGQPAVHAVDRVLHLFVVALAGDFDPLAQIAAADQRQDPVALADRQQDGVQHFVHVLDDSGVGALELLRCAALRQPAFS